MGVLKQPMASLRLAVAIRYWHCARIVLENQIRDVEFMEPVGHLSSMSVELALKAYLLEHGMTDQQIGKQRIQHDLAEILRHCIENGLKLEEPEVEMILLMRKAHYDHFHRYGPKDFDGAFTIVLADEQAALRKIARVIDIIAGDPNDLRHRHGSAEPTEWPATEAPKEPVTLQLFKEMADRADDKAARIEAIGKPHSKMRPEK